MNKQGRIVVVDGIPKVVGGIEWLKWILRNGIERQGYTWNVVAGCLHRCEWLMPDGTTAVCYAKTTAEQGVAKVHYPNGFEAHYFHPHRLQEPLSVRQPSRIFPDSMADLLGAWVSSDEIRQVMDVMRRAEWHAFHLLTKNPLRYREFATELPSNVLPGASTPPSFMRGKPLAEERQVRILQRTLAVFAELPEHLVKWLSAEPLSFDIAPIVEEVLRTTPHALQWMVTGAASNGRETHQPNVTYLHNLLDVCDRFNIPVFFKGNLDPAIVGGRWREDFPVNDPLRRFDTLEV